MLSDDDAIELLGLLIRRANLTMRKRFRHHVIFKYIGLCRQEKLPCLDSTTFLPTTTNQGI